MDKKIIELNEDQKSVCLSALKDINDQLGFMYSLIKENKLDEEMRDTLSSLFEYRMADLSKQTGYDGMSTKKVEEKHSEIRNLNMKIRKLEEKIGSQDLTDKLKEQIKYLTGLVDKWWDIEGFKFIREMSFRKYGLFEAKLGFSFNDFSSHYSDKPITRKEKHKTWLEQLEERGFKVVKYKGDGAMLIDCDENRKLLINMIKNRIPSAEIIQWENYNVSRRNEEELFEIRQLEILIRDAQDIKKLEGYINKFKEIDDEA